MSSALGSMPSAPLDAAAANATTRWLVPELATLPVAARRCVVQSKLDGAAIELSSGEHAVLRACEGCGTLEEHATHAAAQLGAPPEHKSAIRELLDRCARAGLLRTLPDLVQRFGAPSAAESEPLAAVAIRTADRPQLLARLLASAEAIEARSGRRRRWIVVDDSRESANEHANRSAIDAHRKLETEHIDRAQSDMLIDALRAEFSASSREIDWLLGAGVPGEATYGRPLNHALLRLAGHKFASIDDDVLLEPRRPALCEDGFAVSDDSDELVWFDDDQSLWDACPVLTLDPIVEHEQWLGLPLADAWLKAERQAGPLALIRMQPGEARRFDARARVLFTHNHACGDPGSSLLPLQQLTLPEHSRRWLEGNPGAAAYAFEQRINWRGQVRLRLAPQRVLNFTTMVGIDNRSLLPPAPRNQRNEDLVFGIAAQSMYPASWVADLPFGLAHLRATAKRWLSSSTPCGQDLLQVAYSYLDENASRIAAESAQARLAAIGALLLDLAAASDRELGALLARCAAQVGSQLLFAIQAQLDDPRLPAAWKRALAPWLRSPALVLDADVLRGRLGDRAHLRAFVRSYGSAVLAWPQLWEFCRQRYR